MKQKKKDAKQQHPVPVPATPDRCEPIPTEDTNAGRRAKPCPEGYPEAQPTDEPKEERLGTRTPRRGPEP